MFNVVGLDIFFICNLFLFIEEVSNPTVIHGSLLMYCFICELLLEEKLLHVLFAGCVYKCYKLYLHHLNYMYIC